LSFYSSSSSLSSQGKTENENQQSIEGKERNESDPPHHGSDHLKSFSSLSNTDCGDGDERREERDEGTSRNTNQESDQLNHSRKRPRSPLTQQENRKEGGEEEDEDDFISPQSKRHRP